MYFMKCSFAFVLWLLAVHTCAFAQVPPNLSGTWVFSAGDSQNVGMMVDVQYTSTLTQTGKSLVVRDDSVYNGTTQSRQTSYDLTGASTSNESPMGEKAQTVSHWDGSRLITVWTTVGAVAGTTATRTETRSLSADGKTMTLESSRAAKPPMIMVFHRK
jgi:hypothetical protein